MELNLVIPQAACDLAEKIMSMLFVEVIDDKTKQDASDQLKAHSSYVKEFLAIIEPIKKEIKAPGVAFDKALKPITDMIKDWETRQKQSLGKFMLENENEKTRTFYSQSSVKEKVSARIIDFATFAETLLQNGQRGAFEMIFSDYNESKLNLWCESQGIDGIKSLYPGLEVKIVAKINNR
jgi:hypothetical protein